MIRIIISLLFFFAVNVCAAQSQPQMADSFRADGKIYVVISVLAIIFISILLFLVYIERKLNRLEKELHNTQKVQ